MISDCNLIAKKNNLDFTYSIVWLHSLNIMRGYLFVNNNVKDLYLNLLFEAYWEDNQDISNKEVLITLIEKCKIDFDIFLEGINNKNIKDELKNITTEMKSLKFLEHLLLLLIIKYIGGMIDWSSL